MAAQAWGAWLGKWGVMANLHGLSFWGDENVLNLIVGMVT